VATVAKGFPQPPDRLNREGSGRPFQQFVLTRKSAKLLQQAVSADLPLKSGETMARVYIAPNGGIIASTADGKGRFCKWSDFSPDALIAIHRVLVKNTTNEVELLRRHECAISFDWLAGNRERAISAAAVISQGSPEFKERWDAISAGFPQ
jgi:hypothetical protein